MISLLVIFYFFQIYRSANVPNYQINGLYYLYNSTNGDDWNWNTNGTIWDFNVPDANPCEDEWQGIICSCNSTICLIDSLILPDFNLVGRLPEQLYLLSGLKSLVLPVNCISGSLPENLELFSELRILGLFSNLISGSVPTWLDSLALLENVGLNFNLLSGSLPSSIGNLQLLTGLYLGNNYFTGPIPEFLTPISLKSFLVGYNLLTGQIPPVLFQMTSLEEFVLTINCISGTIPVEIGGLTGLSVLDLTSNFFSGSIPETITKLNLTGLLMGANILNGTVPNDIEMMSSLRAISLYKNKFSGTIPAGIGKLSLVSFLALYVNRFTGLIPREICSNLALTSLLLTENLLTGAVPECIGYLTNLEGLDLGRNYLYGTLPESIGNLGSLSALGVFNCYLNGTLPSSLGNLIRLQDLSVDFNSFSGTIPRELGKLVLLTSMYLYFNKLTGSIPSSFMFLIELTGLFLYENHLTGPLPTYLNLLPNLHYVILSNNHFSGGIPESLGNASLLESLYLYHNSLTATIPSSLGKLVRMIFLELQHNKFTGSIPSDIRNLQLLQSFEVGHNYLHGPWFKDFSSLPELITVRLYDNFFTGNVFFEYPDQLSTVDISNNQFEGELPFEVFTKNLTTFVASKNCFSGSLSDNMCNALKLEVLEISGLAAGTGCALYHTLYNSHIYFSNYIPGRIPKCLFELLSLSLFYASGNGIYSPLYDIPLRSNLSNFSLANNRLYGSIPKSIQRHPGFHLLDLSYNMLTGTIDELGNFGDAVIVNRSSLFLESNQLSGVIPHNLLDADIEISILDGNLFSCGIFSTAGLPKNDKYKEKYVCGSNELDLFLYGYCIIFTACIGFCVFVLYDFAQSNMHQIIGLKRLFILSFQYVMWGTSLCEDPVLYNIAVSFGKFREFCYWILVYIVGFCLPAYVALKVNFKSQTYQYGWFISYGFMHGTPPTVVISIIWLSLCIMLIIIGIKRLHVNLFSNNNVHRLFTSSHSKGWKEWDWNSVQMVVTFVVNILIVALVNGAYVYVVLTQSTILRYFVLIGVVIFKLIWNFKIVNYLMKFRAGNLTLLTTMVFNNILGPILATMVVDVSCFQNLFIPPPSITERYFFKECFFFTPLLNNSCVVSIPLFSESTFYPPFIYSFQCGSALLENYVPIFVALYCMLGMVIPILNFVVLAYFSELSDESFAHLSSESPVGSERLLKKAELWKKIKANMSFYSFISCRILCNLVLPLNVQEDLDRETVILSKSVDHTSNLVIDDKWRPFYHIKYLCLNLAVSFLVLLSFGLAYPPLAIIIVIQIITTSVLLQVSLGNHWRQLKLRNTSSALEHWYRHVNRECAGGHEILFYYTIPFLLFCTTFVCVFLIDMSKNYIASVVVFILCSLLLLAHVLRRNRTSVTVQDASDAFELKPSMGKITETENPLH